MSGKNTTNPKPRQRGWRKPKPTARNVPISALDREGLVLFNGVLIKFNGVLIKFQ